MKQLVLSLAALAIFALSQGIARADEVTVAGSSTGIVTGAPQLTFTGNPNFTATTAPPGIGGFSGANSFGTFTLNPALPQIINGTFALNLIFTIPSGIAGGQSATFTSTLFGSITTIPNQGAVVVVFDHGGQLDFNFDDGVTKGGFSIVIPDLVVQNGQTAQLTAQLTGAQKTAVPEPATLFLLGTGITGIAARLRKRRKAKKDAEPEL